MKTRKRTISCAFHLSSGRSTCNLVQIKFPQPMKLTYQAGHQIPAVNCLHARDSLREKLWASEAAPERWVAGHRHNSARGCEATSEAPLPAPHTERTVASCRKSPSTSRPACTLTTALCCRQNKGWKKANLKSNLNLQPNNEDLLSFPTMERENNWISPKE